MTGPSRRIALGACAAIATEAGGLGRVLAVAGPPAFYSHGGQYTMLRPPMSVPSLPITTAGGSSIDFAALHGKIVVLNFWATWCIPCVYEMPSLDRLQALRADRGLSVVPVGMDRSGKPAIVAFYQRLGLSHLGVFADPQRQVGYFQTSNPGHGVFPLHALPITYLIDPQRRVRGYVPGAAEWDSPQAMALFNHLAGR